MKCRVYLAGPMSRGDAVDNLAAALKAFRFLIADGYAPLCPQLSYFAEPFMRDFTHEDWLGIDLPWVSVADAVLRLPGESDGADMETAVAEMKGIPVFHSIDDLCHAFPVPD